MASEANFLLQSRELQCKATHWGDGRGGKLGQWHGLKLVAEDQRLPEEYVARV